MRLKSSQSKNNNGPVVEYYMLAHNERDTETKQSVVPMINDFGRADGRIR